MSDCYKPLEWMARMDDEGVRWQKYYPQSDFEADDFIAYVNMNQEQQVISTSKYYQRHAFVHGVAGMLWGWA